MNHLRPNTIKASIPDYQGIEASLFLDFLENRTPNSFESYM